MGVPDGSVVKNLPASSGHAEDAGSIPGSGRSTGGGTVLITGWGIKIPHAVWCGQTTTKKEFLPINRHHKEIKI